MAKPLIDRLGQNGQSDYQSFGDDPAIKECTEKLKKALLDAPVLAHPEFRSPNKFILDTGMRVNPLVIVLTLNLIRFLGGKSCHRSMFKSSPRIEGKIDCLGREEVN